VQPTRLGHPRVGRGHQRLVNPWCRPAALGEAITSVFIGASGTLHDPAQSDVINDVDAGQLSSSYRALRRICRMSNVDAAAPMTTTKDVLAAQTRDVLPQD